MWVGIIMAIPNINLELPNMRIPSESHLTVYNTVDCIVNPLPLEDLLIVGHSDKKAKAWEEEALGAQVNCIRDSISGIKMTLFLNQNDPASKRSFFNIRSKVSQK
jgi:hypothetical protein